VTQPAKPSAHTSQHEAPQEIVTTTMPRSAGAGG
jgi:hypothetical protein